MQDNCGVLVWMMKIISSSTHEISLLTKTNIHWYEIHEILNIIGFRNGLCYLERTTGTCDVQRKDSKSIEALIVSFRRLEKDWENSSYSGKALLA